MAASLTFGLEKDVDTSWKGRTIRQWRDMHCYLQWNKLLHKIVSPVGSRRTVVLGYQVSVQEVKARSHRPNGRITYGSLTIPDFCSSFTLFRGVVRGWAWCAIWARITYGLRKNGVNFVRNTFAKQSFEPFKTCNRVKLAQKSGIVRDPFVILAFGPVWPGLNTQEISNHQGCFRISTYIMDVFLYKWMLCIVAWLEMIQNYDNINYPTIMVV